MHISQNSEKQGGETLYTTATVDDVVFFLCSLKTSATIDSRILFHFMQSPQVVYEMQHKHHDWLAFAFEASELDLFPFNTLDIQTNKQDDEFLMLTRTQGCFLALYAKHPHLTFVQQLKPFFTQFAQENDGRKIADNWFVPLCLAHTINKTLEELNAKKQLETRKQREKSIENALSNQLNQSGINVKQQVHCRVGIADIVTQDSIYEVKTELTLQALRHAIAQVLAYRVYINPTAKVYVVGYKPNKGEIAYDLAHSLGVEIIIWEIPSDDQTTTEESIQQLQNETLK